PFSPALITSTARRSVRNRVGERDTRDWSQDVARNTGGVSAAVYRATMTLLATPTAGAWNPLSDTSGGAGYLSVYLSEPVARYPIRHVTKKANNKSDPNIETGTYGMFSTCERLMRRKIVQEGRRYLFFLTSHRTRGRVLTGCYKLGWFAEST